MSAAIGVLRFELDPELARRTEVGAIVAASPGDLLERAVRLDLDDGVELTVTDAGEDAHEAGWPITWREAAVWDGDDRLVELRLAALVRVHEHGAVLLFRAADRAALADAEPLLRRALRSAAIVWAPGPLTEDDLLEWFTGGEDHVGS